MLLLLLFVLLLLLLLTLSFFLFLLRNNNTDESEEDLAINSGIIIVCVVLGDINACIVVEGEVISMVFARLVSEELDIDSSKEVENLTVTVGLKKHEDNARNNVFALTFISNSISGNFSPFSSRLCERGLTFAL
jgi:hypothetical protein